jgi:hypothetical protein
VDIVLLLLLEVLGVATVERVVDVMVGILLLPEDAVMPTGLLLIPENAVIGLTEVLLLSEDAVIRLTGVLLLPEATVAELTGVLLLSEDAVTEPMGALLLPEDIVVGLARMLLPSEDAVTRRIEVLLVCPNKAGAEEVSVLEASNTVDSEVDVTVMVGVLLLLKLIPNEAELEIDSDFINEALFDANNETD